jgi:hypothetical protein
MNPTFLRLEILSSLHKELTELSRAQDKFDQEQLVDAISQALLSGDFIKYIAPAEPQRNPQWNGGMPTMPELSSKFTHSFRGTVVYIPGHGIETLRSEVTRLQTALQKIASLAPCIHEGRCFYPMFDQDGEPVGEQDVDPIAVIGEMQGIASDALQD